MGFLDIATTQPCSQNNAYTISIQPHFCNKFDLGNQKRSSLSWKSFGVLGLVKKFSSGKINVSRGRLVIRAVATFKCIEVTEFTEQLGRYHNLRTSFESSSSTPMTTEQLSTDEDSAELEESEQLRRSRISKANKGKAPWNKGRKHSEETLRKIRERTKIAMQNPKVKMKLVKLGHAQSEETKFKIGVGVRMGWERRRQKLRLQETCCYEWQNLIADTSRKGLLGEEELQWDSYAVLDKQLKEEWLQSVEQRKKMPRLKGSKRAPKSEEQRRKISEAISAKWADPTYRTRVTSALAKYHGIPEGVVRKPRRKTSGDGEPRKSVTKKNADELVKLENKSNNQIQRVMPRKRKAPPFKDPLASSKLDMLKNIRAQRAAAENKQAVAIARAKALISESEKASEALEAAVDKNPLAQESLIEARMLTAQAKRLIESIEKADLNSLVNGASSLLASSDLLAYSEKKVLDDTASKKVNGSQCLGPSPGSIDDPVPDNYDKVNGERYEGLPLNSKIFDLPNGSKSLFLRSTDSDVSHEEMNKVIKHSTFQGHHRSAPVNGSAQNTELPLGNRLRTLPEDDRPHKSMNKSKKWVRGRLVEVLEGS